MGTLHAMILRLLFKNSVTSQVGLVHNSRVFAIAVFASLGGL